MQYWLGKAALAKGDSALAEKSFRQAAQLNPLTGAHRRNWRGSQSARRHEYAAEVADKTIAAAPRFPAAMFGAPSWR